MSGRLPRSRPEWITFAVSAAVLAVVIVLIAVQAAGPNARPAPVATRTGKAQLVGERYFVPVRLTNNGDQTAKNVQVSAELRTGAAPRRAIRWSTSSPATSPWSSSSPSTTIPTARE